MAAEKSPPDQEEEWELLPSNTSFLEFGLEDIKDLISTEIDYMDYLREEHMLKLTKDQQEMERKTLAAELTTSTNQASNKRMTALLEEFVGTKAEDPKQICTEEIYRGNKFEDKGSATDEKKKKKENSAERRGLAASIGMLCSVAAAAATAVCVVMLGGGLQFQHRRQEELRFQIYTDNKTLKRLNQSLVKAREPAPAMRTAIISFGGFFDGL